MRRAFLAFLLLLGCASFIYQSGVPILGSTWQGSSGGGGNCTSCAFVTNGTPGIGSGTNANNIKATVTSTTGDTMAVLIATATSTNSVVSVCDGTGTTGCTGGNTYTLCSGSSNSFAATGEMEIWVSPNVTGNTNGVIVTWTTADKFQQVVPAEYSGNTATSSICDVSAVGTTASVLNPTVTAPNTGSFTPTQAGDVCVTLAITSNGAGWTAGDVNYTHRNTNSGGGYMQDRLNSPASAQTASATATGTEAASSTVACLK